MSKPKQRKSGTKKARKALAPRQQQREMLNAVAEGNARAQRSMRLLLRVIAWLMQHRDEWNEGEAKITLAALDADVDVGLYYDHDAGQLLVVPAPPPPAEAQPAAEAAPEVTP